MVPHDVESMSKFTQLSNGIRLYIDPMNDLQSAAIGIWASAGAIDESPPEGGLAHLLEHMAFKGTNGRTARDIAEEIEAVGGYLNAATSYQRTGYFARVLKGDIDTAVDILADILTDPLFDEEELSKEQEVVVQEIGEAWDAPDDAAMDLLQSVAFKGQPLGRPILGTIEGVRSHDSRRLRSFMDFHYTPDNLIVAVAGAVDTEAFTSLVKDRLSKLEGACSKGRGTPQYFGGSACDQRDIEQTHIALAFSAVGAQHRDYYATRIFAEALGGGMASRLFQAIREERGLAYSVYAYADCYDDAGLIGVYMGTDAANAEAAVTLARQQIEDMLQALAPAELDRARAMLTSSLMMGLELPSGRIETAVSQICTYGAPIEPEAICRELENVTVEDVQRCADRALRSAPSAIAVVGPGDVSAFADASGAMR